MVSPILIPSKGRPSENFLQKVQNSGLKHVIFIEPQDERIYRISLPKANFEVLPENNKGITFVRNYIKEYAEKKTLKRYWLLDDDLRSFRECRNGRVITSRMNEILQMAELELTAQPNFILGALDYSKNAWTKKGQVVKNSYCEVCVLIETKKLKPFKYRENVKEDRDMVLQILSSGGNVYRSTRFSFSFVTNGSNAGGLYECYNLGMEETWAKNMEKIWGKEICQVKIKNQKSRRRVDCKINWKYFQ